MKFVNDVQSGPPTSMWWTLDTVTLIWCFEIVPWVVPVASYAWLLNELCVLYRSSCTSTRCILVISSCYNELAASFVSAFGFITVKPRVCPSSYNMLHFILILYYKLLICYYTLQRSRCVDKPLWRFVCLLENPCNYTYTQTVYDDLGFYKKITATYKHHYAWRVFCWCCVLGINT